MIAVEPNLRQVGEAVVLGDLPRRQVAVVVDDRQIAGEAVIEFDRTVVLQEKVFGDEDVVHVQIPSGGSAAANSAKPAAIAARSMPEGKNQALARPRRITPFSNDSVGNNCWRKWWRADVADFRSQLHGGLDRPDGPSPPATNPGGEKTFSMESNFSATVTSGRTLSRRTSCRQSSRSVSHGHQQIDAGKPRVAWRRLRLHAKADRRGPHRAGPFRRPRSNHRRERANPRASRCRRIGSNHRRPAGGRRTKADRGRKSFVSPSAGRLASKASDTAGRFNRATWPSKSQHLEIHMVA